MYINEDQQILNIKSQLQQNSKDINTFNEVDMLVYQIETLNKRLYIRFADRSLKQYFIDIIPTQTFQIINCNSSIDRFSADMISYNKYSIFNNINLCRDVEILNIINNTNNILIH